MPTTVRHIRVNDETWAAWEAAAAAAKMSVSELIRDAVEARIRSGVEPPVPRPKTDVQKPTDRGRVQVKTDFKKTTKR